MSQAKVDKYKKEKANRAQIIKKEKREKMLWKIGGYLFCLLVVCWIGFSAYSKFHVEEEKSYEVVTTAVDDYLNGLTETEVESEAETEGDTESTSEESTEAQSEEVTETASEAASEETAETEIES